MKSINGIARPGGPPALIAVVLVALVVLVAIYLIVREPDEPEPIPEPSRPIESVAPAETAEERGDNAREIIEELRSRGSGVDYAEAYERAQQFQADRRFADAQLLYFFAARGGHAPAAFDLAALHDPNHHSQDASLVDEPDPFQAYRWYTVARDGGHESADERLADLRSWAENAARAGDSVAERLLLQWE
jgi:TPR repeat protein